MSGLVSIIAPVFALIAMGAAAVRLRLVDAGGVRGLTDFVFFLGLPALLFGAVAEAPHLRMIGAASVYFSACLLVYAASLLLSRVLLRAGLARGAMVGLNASYGNTVMLGIPVIRAAYGDAGLATLLPIIALHSALLLPLASALIEFGGHGETHIPAMLARTARGLLRNPIIMSIVLAFLWRAGGLVLPDAVRRLLDLLGAGAPALALFCLGASLPGFSVRGAWAEAVLSSAMKLALLPAAVAGFALLAGLRGMPLGVAVVTAGMPTGANAFLLARRTGTLLDGSASTVVISTALSLLSLTALLLWLR